MLVHSSIRNSSFVIRNYKGGIIPRTPWNRQDDTSRDQGAMNLVFVANAFYSDYSCSHRCLPQQVAQVRIAKLNWDKFMGYNGKSKAKLA